AETAKLQEDYLRHVTAELEALDPQVGEEAALAEKRTLLLSREKMNDTFVQATGLLEGEEGAQALVGRVETMLERLSSRTGGELLAAVLDAAARARVELDELSFQIERLKGGQGNADDLQAVEERYFALRE